MSTWHLPAIHRFSLPSGLSVWLLEREDLPLVSVTLVLPRGANEDPRGMEGTAYLCGATLDTGTTTRSALEISGSLENLGSSVRLHTGHDGTSIGLTTLLRNLRPSLEILGDILAHPTFPAPEVERKRTQHLTSIAQQKDRASALASQVFHRLVYGASHPYGTEAGGTERSLRSISREGVAGYFRGHLTPDCCVAIVIGPISADDCRRLLGQALSLWQGSPAAASSLQVPPPSSRKGIFLIDRPGSPQAEIRLGHPSIPRNSADFFPVIIVNRILGGQFSSRLNANLRERRGFTYGAWSTFGFGRLGGPFVAGAAVNTADTGPALAEMLSEVRGIGEGNATSKEVAFAVEGIAGGFGLMFETPAQIAGVLQNIVLYNLGEEYYNSYLDSLRGVTLEQVNAAAVKYLSGGATTIVVAGDAATITPGMSALGEVTATGADEVGI
jgi:zinc protease